MTKNKREAGFGIIELFLLILLILLIIFILWWVFWRQNSQPAANSDNQSNSSQQQANQAQTQDPMAGWKEYCSPIEGGCFKYPADWKLQDDPNNTPPGPGEEFKQLVSPAGTTVNWAALITGVGGTCDPETDPIIHIKSAKAVPGAANVYAASITKGANGDVFSMGLVNGTNGQPPQTGSTGDCLYIEMFKSKDGKRQMWLSAGTLKQEDIATVELILTSYHY